MRGMITRCPRFSHIQILSTMNLGALKQNDEGELTFLFNAINSSTGLVLKVF